MGTLTFTKSVALTVTFSMAIILFAIGVANDSGSTINIANDPSISNLSGSLSGNATLLASSSEETYSSIKNTTITTGDTSKSGTQFETTGKPSLNTATSILDTAYKVLFGTDESSGKFKIFFNVLVGFLTLMVILYVWKTWKGGNPD